MGNLPKAQLTILLVTVAFFNQSGATLSTLFNVDLFPVINVTFVNEASHPVELVCSAEEVRDKIVVLGPGEVTWWTVRDVLFPLVWCYVEINETVWGMFWGYQAKLRCFSHCDWRIREDGMWLKQKHGHFEDQMWLSHNGGGF